MLDKIVGKSTDYLVKNRVIEEDDRDVYEYGFHALYGNIIDITSIIIISIWFKQVPETVLYHIAFVFLRNTAGGFHAKTRIQCFVISTAMWLLSLWCIAHLASPVVCIGISALSVILVWLKTPVEHENSPLSDEKRYRMKRISRIASVLLFMTVLLTTLVLSESYAWIPAALGYGMASHTILILIAVIESRVFTKAPA